MHEKSSSDLRRLKPDRLCELRKLMHEKCSGSLNRLTPDNVNA